MIDWFRDWSKSIVVAVIIATIIEMILPNNNSKKYIKIVIGIFIVYTIISPVLDKFIGKDFDEIANLENYVEVSSNSVATKEDLSSKTDSSIRAIYSKNLQNDLKTRLKDNGYITDNINVQIADDDSYNIEKIDITITEKLENKNTEKQAKTIVDNIKHVVIELNNNKEEGAIINENDKDIIKQLIRDSYGVKDDSINIS